MKSHSELSQDTTEITSQKQTGDAGCTSSAIDATEDLEESMQGPSHLSNLQRKEDQTDLESSSISHYDIGYQEVKFVSVISVEMCLRDVVQRR